MIRYLTLEELIELHHQVMQQSQGVIDIRDIGGLGSAISQPRMTFGGEDL